MAAGFLQAQNPESPRSEWVLRVPHERRDAVRGNPDAETHGWFRYRDREESPAVGELVCPEDLRGRLARLPELIERGRVAQVVLRCTPGAPAEELAGSLARSLDRHLVCAEGAELEAGRGGPLGPLCTLARALPLLHYELGPGETARPPALAGYAGPLAIALGREGGVDARANDRSVTLELPAPEPALRRRFWRASLAGSALEDEEAVVSRFRLGGAFIAKVSKLAAAEAELGGRRALATGDVRAACRALNRELLDQLAEALEARGGWDDLVAGETTADKLGELTRRCRHRERLLERLGAGFGGGCNCGVRALFTGSSGTGKTLAAKILAAELGMDLYRVDLAAIVNKYIGETEKNLHRVLSRAEALDVVLLLDEGDALLGQRTEVKSANDRYANLETNYLLQRLENYEGIVVVTTNLGDNIDPAFQRRMDVVVPFFPPRAAERLRILDVHLPGDHRIEPEYLELVARRCSLSGGQLRNAALQAALLALDGGGALDRAHLHAALQSEYGKAGGAFPLARAEAGDGAEARLGSFVAALAER